MSIYSEIEHLKRVRRERILERNALSYQIKAIDQTLVKLKRQLKQELKKKPKKPEAPKAPAPKRRLRPPDMQEERLLTLPEAAELTKLSPTTLVRHYPQFVIQVSKRRFGIKYKNVVAIRDGKAVAGK